MILGAMRMQTRALPRLSSNTMFRPLFNTTQKTVVRSLGTIPQPPGGIIGTANEPSKIPSPNKTKGSYHWAFEKVVLMGMVPLTVYPFLGGPLTPVLDATLGSLLIVHCHVGFESCIIDYIPSRVYGKWYNVAKYALWGGTLTALYGVYEFETNDVGITESIRKVWNA